MAMDMENGGYPIRIRIGKLVYSENVKSSSCLLNWIYFIGITIVIPRLSLLYLPPCHWTQGIYTSPDLTPHPD